MGEFNEQKPRKLGQHVQSSWVLSAHPAHGEYAEFAAAHPDGTRATRQGRSLGAEAAEILF